MGHPRGEVLFEFLQIGDTVKVSAVDARTNTEVSLVGSARASRAALQQAALQKLRYVIGKAEAEKRAKSGH